MFFHYGMVWKITLDSTSIDFANVMITVVQLIQFEQISITE